MQSAVETVADIQNKIFDFVSHKSYIVCPTRENHYISIKQIEILRTLIGHIQNNNDSIPQLENMHTWLKFHSI